VGIGLVEVEVEVEMAVKVNFLVRIAQARQRRRSSRQKRRADNGRFCPLRTTFSSKDGPLGRAWEGLNACDGGWE
jgi:hypothetical protein